jgi:hypothetical protein
MARELIRRAALVLDLIRHYVPKAVMSKPGAGDLGIPE